MSLVAASGAAAETCALALGTYLTKKVDTSGVAKGVEGRTILSLAPSGFASMTDSAQGGITGYQAFGMMQGNWSCTPSGGAGVTEVEATLLDFSYPNEADPEAKIARVEISARIDASGKLDGKTEIKIYALFDDPISGQEPEVSIGYEFEGQRILEQVGSG